MRHLALVKDDLTDTNAKCEFAQCSVGFAFGNIWLERLRFAPRTVLFITLSAQAGKVVSRTSSFELGTGPGAFGAYVMESAGQPIPDDFLVSPSVAGKEEWRVTVRLKPSATPEQRSLAYGFRLACITRIGGCSDSRDLLPGAWNTVSLPVRD